MALGGPIVFYSSTAPNPNNWQNSILHLPCLLEQQFQLETRRFLGGRALNCPNASG